MKSELPEAILQPRTYLFDDHEAFTPTQIELRVPDLTDFPRESWAVWGPMHEIKTARDVRITVKIDFPIGNDIETPAIESYLRPHSIRIESPILAKEREKTPLVKTIEWSERGIIFYVYFDTELNIARTEIRRIGRLQQARHA